MYNYKFKMSIGDWSGDGHGRHEDYVILSSHPVEDVRQAHYDMELNTGINVEKICNEYEENSIPFTHPVFAVLKEANLLENFLSKEELEQAEEDENFDKHIYINPFNMATIWITLLMKSNPDLELDIEPEMTTLHHYGLSLDQRGENKHISFVGYGTLD